MSPANKADVLVLYTDRALDYEADAITMGGDWDYVAMETLIHSEVNLRTNPAFLASGVGDFSIEVVRTQQVRGARDTDTL